MSGRQWDPMEGSVITDPYRSAEELWRDPSTHAEVYYTYTTAEGNERKHIIDLIEAEKRAYYARVEPLMQQLARIHGKPHFVVRTGPR